MLWSLLEDQGSKVDYHDPHVPVIRPSREHSRFAGRRNVELNEASVREYDLILVTTKHDAVDYAMIAKNAKLIVDTRNAFNGLIERPEIYVKA